MINWPAPLIDKIARRDCVILIGSGVSANSMDSQGNRPPTWYDFLIRAKGELTVCPKYLSNAINGYRYLEACEYLRELLGQRWMEVVREAFHLPAYKHAKIHEHIFDLDSRIVASLNFDRIYDTYANTKSQGTYITKNYFDEDIGRVSSGVDKYLIKLHGSIDFPDKLIFSTTDYARARQKNSVFYRILDSLVVTNSFVIIGCGLNDPDLQLLFENYKYSYGLSDHYMLHPKPIKEQQKALLRNSRGINVIEYSSSDNHADLTASLERLVTLVSDQRDAIAREQSW